MKEQELIEELKLGNQAAFRHLVESYQSMVVNTAMGMLHNMADAEDVAQEVFIQVYNSIHDFRLESSLKTWIYRITITRSLNAVRSKGRKSFFTRLEDFFLTKREVGIGESSLPNPQKRLEEMDHSEAIQSAMNTLPDNQKVAFTLSKYEDLSYKEIAEVMQVSKSSVESLLYRAKVNLQKKLLDYYKNFNE
ncbi:RNA polymerase sigma factor [Marinifilum fragile]|uniref:RNA polymerase sigma factor n=1 Tax=Marinifilum fragile TaxID=570161 RepID=UPI002AA9003A|nr:RNA polymerase sigma factor [Marinifilum fragile]